MCVCNIIYLPCGFKNNSYVIEHSWLRILVCHGLAHTFESGNKIYVCLNFVRVVPSYLYRLEMYLSSLWKIDVLRYIYVYKNNIQSIIVFLRKYISFEWWYLLLSIKSEYFYNYNILLLWLISISIWKTKIRYESAVSFHRILYI